MDKQEREGLIKEIVDAAFHVHKELGPGLLESVYDLCLCKELFVREIPYQRQLLLPVSYKGELLDADFRIDILVANEIVVELKAVEGVLPVHEAQILTYLKLAEKRFGLLINFNVPLIKQGIRRFVNGYEQ